MHSESSNLRRIAVALTLNPNLWRWNPNNHRLPFLEYPKFIPYTKFEHFGIIRLWVMLQT